MSFVKPRDGSPSPLMGEGKDGGKTLFTPHLSPPPQGGRKIFLRFAMVMRNLLYPPRNDVQKQKSDYHIFSINLARR